MRKKNTLYTVNKWNKPAFKYGGNLFDGLHGSNIMQKDPNAFFGVGLTSPNITQKIDWTDPVQRAAAVGTSAGLVNGFKDIAEANNPFSATKALTTGTKGLTSGLRNIGLGILGGIGNSLANNLISDGYDAGGAGNAVANIGNQVGGLVGNIPGVGTLAGPAIQFASGLVGGAINRAFGKKTDQQALNNAKEGINYYNNFTSNASTFNDVKGLQAMADFKNPYKGGWFKSVSGENNALREGFENAKLYAENSLINNINNIAADQINNAQRELMAYGGALGLMQQNRYFDAIDKRTDAIAGKNNSFMGKPQGTLFAGGGLKTTFLDEFGSDPIGAAVRYNQGLEALAAQEEARQMEAAREQEYADMQKRLLSLETENQGLQALMAAQPTYNEGIVGSVVGSEPSGISSSTPLPATINRGSSLKDSLKMSEGFLSKASTLGNEKHPTIGYGFYDVYPGTNRKVKAGDTITKEEADRYLDVAIQEREKELSSKVPNWKKMNQGQRDALIDLAFNAGSHAAHFKKNSRLMKALEREDWDAASLELATTSKDPSLKKGMQNRSNRRKDMFVNGNYGIKAFGGELGTNGTDWTNGLLYIDEGGSHESNPFEGVPMGLDPEGIPNLVEEGETVYNNYVFSDRMMVPHFMYKELGLGGALSKGISFADASKKLAWESEQRPNDPISQAGLEASLSKLAEVQEAERMRKQAKEYMGLDGYACGGKLGNRYDTGSKLKKYGYYTNGSDGIAAPSGDLFTVDSNGLINKKTGYTQKYRNLVASRTADDIRKWASDRGWKPGDYSKVTDSSLKSFLDRGNKLEDLTDKQWRTGATDGKYGFMHHVAEQIANEPQNIPAEFGVQGTAYPWENVGDTPAPLSPLQQIARDKSTPERTISVADNNTNLKATHHSFPETRGLSGIVGEEEEGSGVPTYATWMRYAPVVGAGIMSMTDALGLTNNPDYGMADRLEGFGRSVSQGADVRYDPIGDYMRFVPLDRLFKQNQLDAIARAAERTIINSSLPAATKYAALLANNYNNQKASGELFRQEQEYNDANRRFAKEFNRKTNMFNSQMGLEAAMANARNRQQSQQLGLSALGQAAALRDSIDARIGAAKSANLTNFLTSLGNIGRENFALNQINWDRSRHYTTDASGRSGYKRKKSCGGKMNRQ